MKEKSRMIVIPNREQDLEDVTVFLNRIANAEGIRILEHKFEENLILTLEIEAEKYVVELFPITLTISSMFRTQHLFPDVDMEKVERAEAGLEISMDFSENALRSYHAQLKVAHALLPDAVAVLDASAEKILSGKWVRLAALSKVPPAPRYIYIVQAVAGENDDVWLHSHGMNRCGLPELEILNSTKDMYQTHYSVIENMANRMLELEEPLSQKEPLYIGSLSPGIPLVTTLVDWKEALEHYPKDILGGESDREDGHNENTCCVFVYPDEEDYKNGRLSLVSEFDEYLKNNPMFLISTEETQRMRALALERLDYMLRAAKDKKNVILVKIGIDMDEEHQTEDNQFEYIWFELLKPMMGTIKCRLTQEPYFVKGMHEGSKGVYSYDRITDWLIYTKERRITADDVYLLE